MSNLPDGYTQVEYIESTGTQYIDTGIKANPKYSIEVIFTLPQCLEMYETIFGTRNGSNSRMTMRFSDYINGGSLGYQYSNSGTGVLSFIEDTTHPKQYFLDTFHSVKFVKNVVYVDNIIAKEFDAPIDSISYPYNTFLFALDDVGNPTDYAHIKVSSCKMWNENNVLVRDFIPCISDTDAIGMYDLVENKFYGNNGTGTFIAGEAVKQYKYLVADEDKLYTVVDGALSELSTTDIVVQTFLDYGIEDIPDGALLVGLSNPEILYWQDSEDDLPTLTATVTATPPYQIIMSRAIDLMHSSIKGIDSITVDCKGDVLFAVSFDNKATWIKHNGTDWVNVADELTGMTKLEFEAITTEQWQTKYELSSNMYIRCTLTDATQSITSVDVSFIN